MASEDTVFLLDISRSMYRRDLDSKPRIYWALLSLKHIIEKKQKVDANDRYSVIMFSDKNYEIDNFVYSFNDLFKFIEENAEIVGRTELPLDKAVKSIINEKRKIGQKIFRIIIVSDGFIHPRVSNPIRYAKVANDLGIIIDTIRFGKGMISGNIIKRLTELTGGVYYFINNLLEYQNVIDKVAEKKKIKMASFLDDNKEDTLDAISKDIASPLLKIEELSDSQQANINFEELKCSICHSKECLTCETSFYGCGRFCPNCLKPIHLHCAIKWSEQQQGNNSNGEDEYKILRCPFCYYLLRIPITLQREKIQLDEFAGENYIRKIKFSDDSSELMTSVCAHPECGIMFDDNMDPNVYKCDACSQYFHIDCIQKDITRTGKCPNCGVPSKLSDR